MGVPKNVIDSFNKLMRNKREEEIILKYKLKESIRTKLSKLGAEDLADDIFEYINLIKEEL